MTDKKTLGSFIKAKRTEKNYSQKELADMLFVTEGAVSKWERGVSYPDITLLSDICRALDISEHELITASTDTETRKLKYEARSFRIIRGTWFWIPTISYAVALLTCFICNLAINHTLSWFFIVLSSLLCAYSFIPTFTSFFESSKLLVFTVTSFLSICILLYTCAAYTDALFWAPTACIGTLMGYVLLFLPILLRNTKIKRYRFLISVVGIFSLTILLLLNIYTWQPFKIIHAIVITCYAFAPVILSSVICLLRFNAFLKAGFCTALCAVAYYFLEYIVDVLFKAATSDYRINFSDWNGCLEGNIYFIYLIACLFISVVFFVIGIIKTYKKACA